MFEKRNWPKRTTAGKVFTICSTVRVLLLYRNRSGVVDLVERGPLMFAKVQNVVTKW